MTPFATRLTRAFANRVEWMRRTFLLRTFEASRAEHYALVHRRARLRDSIIYGNVAISDNCLIRSSKLWGDIEIGPNSRVVESILSGGTIRIGRNTSFNGPGSDIYALHHPVSIGSYCSIARGVAIQEFNHRADRCTSYYINRNFFGGSDKDDTVSAGPITIGSDVWIGSQCVILSGISIGHGAIIGANSVVTRDVPPYAIAVGSPAKVLKYRFPDEVAAALLELKWWEWPDDRLRSNRALFDGPLTLEKVRAASA